MLDQITILPRTQKQLSDHMVASSSKLTSMSFMCPIPYSTLLDSTQSQRQGIHFSLSYTTWQVRFAKIPCRASKVYQTLFIKRESLLYHMTWKTAELDTRLPIERRHPRLETIEACLLFLQRHNTIHRAPTLPGLWGDIGAVVGMAHDLGLNVDPSAWSLPPSDANRRLRIWWALYIQDKWSALGLGRPSYLNDEHSNVPMLTLDNFSHTGLNNEPIGLTPALQFVAMANLTTILSDLLSTFYTLKAIDRVNLLPIEVLYSVMDDFQARIHAFHEEHLCQLYNVNTLLDSSGTVILAFYTVEIVLYRAMLRCLPMNHPGYPTIRQHAKTTLLNIVSFLEKLNVSRLRAFWWSRTYPIPFLRKDQILKNEAAMTRINFALSGTFMFFQLLTSVTTHDIEFWSNTITHYRSLLRLQSHSFDMTKLASTRMDLLAAGMGVDPPQMEDSLEVDGLGGARMENLRGMEQKKTVLTPGSAEEWIEKQGHEEMLHC